MSKVKASETPMLCWFTSGAAGLPQSRRQRNPWVEKECCSSCEPWTSRIRRRSPG